LTTISNSDNIREQMKSYIIALDDATHAQMHNGVKVFVNGAWIGVVEIPAGLRDDLFHRLNAKTHGTAETKQLK
ncbi:MAG: hypothetical protein MIO90_01715, partial [Methanomassiliicoccales archaeon]|nr:hypothetical protein [Methanomassiliicoccales archaeon]